MKERNSRTQDWKKKNFSSWITRDIHFWDRWTHGWNVKKRLEFCKTELKILDTYFNMSFSDSGPRCCHLSRDWLCWQILDTNFNSHYPQLSTLFTSFWGPKLSSDIMHGISKTSLWHNKISNNNNKTNLVALIYALVSQLAGRSFKLWGLQVFILHI